MSLGPVVAKAKKLAIPSKAEQASIDSAVKLVLASVTKEIKRQRLAAKIKVGGSAAKGTWLPGLSDIDFFIIFDYNKFYRFDKKISDHAEKVLKKVFPIQRVRGSRDYFAVKYKKYDLEFVPVLDISKKQKAMNVTDFSPLHVNWVLKKAKNKDQVRVTKQFLKAAGVYGAESYISGLSGHVVDVLVAHYKTFDSFLRRVSKWPDFVVLDPAKHYRGKKEILQELNPSKTTGPLILVDPIEPGRNAAAALGKEKFNLLITVCKKFLSKPSIEFFKEKFITVKDLAGKKRARTLVVFTSSLGRGKIDVMGAKKKKIFETLQKSFAEEDFIPTEANWQFQSKQVSMVPAERVQLGNNKALFWFYFSPKALSKTRSHMGPPLSVGKKHLDGFKKAWKGNKITIKKKRYVVEVKRKHVKPQGLAKALAKEFKLTLVYSG